MEKSFGINPLPIIPVRKDASHRSEMITQLLFGETFSIAYSNDDGWLKITSHYDNYVGFVELKQVDLLTETEFKALNHETWGIIKSPIAVVIKSDSQNGTTIPAGSKLPLKGKVNFNNTSFNYSPEIVHVPNTSRSEETIREDVVQTALKFINSPYLWGGRSCLGIDCSGFSQLVFKINGIAIQRDASQQTNQGNHVGFIDEAKSGDLLFFGLPDENITHVGIYLGEGFVIHASGSVRIDTVDHFGIFNNQTQSYSHQLRTIKDFISK